MTLKEKEIENYQKFRDGSQISLYLSKIPDILRDEAQNLLYVHMWTLEPLTFSCATDKREQILSYLKEYIPNYHN